MAGADFEAFYRANYARLVGQMVPVVGDVHEAEDVVQEAFARASLHWSRVRGYHAPDAWVRRVALNYALSGLRRAGYRRRVVERLAQRAEPVPAASAEVVDMVAALRRLPLRQREVLVLFDVVELPVEEIGRQLRLPVGTLKSRLARGRGRLLPRSADRLGGGQRQDAGDRVAGPAGRLPDHRRWLDLALVLAGRPGPRQGRHRRRLRGRLRGPGHAEL
ncbi:MAG TPA: sigma-70 family RNA polymerase sigma factor, partial [Actinomycetota bacterium]|nr:sigma-70 family RNA polymerase sigma factor [Actinomycetota bacterium]